MDDLSERCRTCLRQLKKIRFSVYDLKKPKSCPENPSFCDMILITTGIQVMFFSVLFKLKCLNILDSRYFVLKIS